MVGKTNMDQFASGLVGTRSPYGVARNAFDYRFIPGGSSSGSGVAVASGLVSFALGTDTAGSGRVPAGYNGCVGIKPTVGSISTVGKVQHAAAVAVVLLLLACCDKCLCCDCRIQQHILARCARMTSWPSVLP